MTAARKDLLRFIGNDADGFFQHVTPEVSFRLPTGHILNNQGSGTCKYEGTVTDHVISSTFFTRERMRAHNLGVGITRQPVAGDRILLAVLPSCTGIVDVDCRASDDGTASDWLDAATGNPGVFPSRDDLSVTGPMAINACAVPPGEAAEAFPDYRLYLGHLNGVRADAANDMSFPTMLLKAAGSDVLLPTADLFMGTGKISNHYAVYAELTADAPENSWLSVSVEVEKPGRF